MIFCLAFFDKNMSKKEKTAKACRAVAATRNRSATELHFVRKIIAKNCFLLYNSCMFIRSVKS